MAMTKSEVEQANRRGETRLRTTPRVVRARYDRSRARVVAELSSGIEVVFSPSHIQGLQGATDAQLSKVEISPSGFGLHFPRLDADVDVPALLEGFTGSKRWMSAEHGRRGGTVSSRIKTAAARRNGSLGGRPRKAKAPA